MIDGQGCGLLGHCCHGDPRRAGEGGWPGVSEDDEERRMRCGGSAANGLPCMLDCAEADGLVFEMGPFQHLAARALTDQSYAPAFGARTRGQSLLMQVCHEYCMRAACGQRRSRASVRLFEGKSRRNSLTTPCVRLSSSYQGAYQSACGVDAAYTLLCCPQITREQYVLASKATQLARSPACLPHDGEGWVPPSKHPGVCLAHDALPFDGILMGRCAVPPLGLAPAVGSKASHVQRCGMGNNLSASITLLAPGPYPMISSVPPHPPPRRRREDV
jgi:hypothetical protein